MASEKIDPPSADEDDADGRLSGLRNPVEFREWFKILFRIWRPSLSPNQFLVALFIFDRTAGWGKEWEEITHRQFLEGVTGRDGRSYAGALRMSEPTLISCLSALHSCGAIMVRPAGKRRKYSLNYEWTPGLNHQPETPEPHPEAMPLAKPKRLQTLQNDPGNGAVNTKKTLGQEAKKTLVCKKREKEEATQKGECLRIHRAAPACGDASAMNASGERHGKLAEAKARSLSRRKERVAAWTAVSAIKAWEDACRDFQPGLSHLAVTKTDGIILHRYGKRWMKAKGQSVARWLEFLEWVVTRWHLIREEQFGWMKASSPGVPSIRFFVRMSDRFEQAADAREQLEAKAAMPTREREIERRVRRGMDREVAAREVDERLGLAKAKADADASVAEIKRQREAAERDARARKDAEERNQRWASRRGRASGLASGQGSFQDWE